MIPWIVGDAPFPNVERALADPNGLLCAGADLSPARLTAAYQHGIFPWFNEGDPILWWSPDPRMVLFPQEFRCSRSLARRLRRSDYEIRLDSDFEQVIRACASTPRAGQDSTWISPRMQRAYLRLHELGIAHSVETWVRGRLAGGLYGIELGHAFFGESMFSHATDASKLALAHLARYLAARDFAVIDCQMSTPHLASLGAREVPRREFCGILESAARSPTAVKWPGNGAVFDWANETGARDGAWRN